MNRNLNKFYNLIKGKKIALCGIGESNLPLIHMFLNKGANIIACDSRTKSELQIDIEGLEKSGVELCLGEDYLKDLNVDIIFRTPGMKYYLPELIQARNKNIVVTSEMEVFFDVCPCPIIAITGSDGKTTTTSIIAKMLEASGKRVYLGGNIGRPLLPSIEEISEDDVAVVELSSFQLISMRKSPDIAVVTNLSPNHLDIHKDMAEYIDAKKNILIHQNAFSRLVLNQDNEITKGFNSSARGQVFYFSRKDKCDNGSWVSESGHIYMSINGKDESIMKSTDIKIPGKHNLENYLAAISALWGLVDKKFMKKVAMEFGGVEHRSEFVREVNGVKYYNDSIASSPTRTASGTLSLYDKKIIIIAGGYDKKIPFDELGPIIVDKVKILILMGDTAEKIEAAVKGASAYKEGNPKIIKVKNMEEAVHAAYENAEYGDIVSMSPACASFDLYKNFIERGNHFKYIVNRL